jgi:hypothetical protein
MVDPRIPTTVISYNQQWNIVKGKAIPVTGHEGP